MSQYIRRFTAPLALGMALAVGACAGGDEADSLSADSTLARDLALANQRDSAALPSLTDTLDATPPAAAPVPDPEPPRAAPAPRPTRPRPAPARPAPTRPAPTPAAEPTTTPSGNTVSRGTGESERALGSIPAGTQLVLTSNSRVCTNTHKVGDTFTATVANSVSGENGAVIPSGATAVVRVTELKRSENANDPIRVGLDVVSVSVGGRSIPLDARTSDAAVERVRNSSRGNDTKKVIGGAVIGAIAGQVLGKDTKSTVIGAATGAAAGTAAAAATANFEGCVGSGGRITVVLNNAATFPVS